MFLSLINVTIKSVAIQRVVHTPNDPTRVLKGWDIQNSMERDQRNSAKVAKGISQPPSWRSRGKVTLNRTFHIMLRGSLGHKSRRLSTIGWDPFSAIWSRAVAAVLLSLIAQAFQSFRDPCPTSFTFRTTWRTWTPSLGRFTH